MSGVEAFNVARRSGQASAWLLATSHATCFYLQFGDTPPGVIAKRPDLKGATAWTRVAGPGSRRSQFDGRWNRLARLSGDRDGGPGDDTPLALGRPFTIGVSFAAPGDWWYSSALTRARSLTYDDLPVLPNRCARCDHTISADFTSLFCSTCED